MKKFIGDVVRVVLWIAVIIGLWWGNANYTHYTMADVLSWLRLAPTPNTAPASSNDGTVETVTPPPAESFSVDQGGESDFTYLENGTATPLPPVCATFNCDVDLANTFWQTIPGESDGYIIPGSITVVAGIDVRRSAEEARTAQPDSTWWDDHYGNTWKKLVVTGRFFARAALDESKIVSNVSSDDGENVRVTLKLPEMCLDSAGLAMSSPNTSDWKPVELRLEVTQTPSELYDSCANGNYVACGSNVMGNPIYDTVDMANAAIQTLGTIALAAMDKSLPLRSRFNQAITGQSVGSDLDPTQTEWISVGLDPFSNHLPESANQRLVAYSQWIGCYVLAQSGRTCDLTKITTVIQTAPAPLHFNYCNGRDFAVFTNDPASYMQTVIPTP